MYIPKSLRLQHGEKHPTYRAFFDAIRNNDKATVERLLRRKINPNATDAIRRSALAVAEARGFDSLAGLLVLYGARSFKRSPES